jgi:hypothetical protein
MACWAVGRSFRIVVDRVRAAPCASRARTASVHRLARSPSVSAPRCHPRASRNSSQRRDSWSIITEAETHGRERACLAILPMLALGHTPPRHRPPRLASASVPGRRACSLRAVRNSRRTRLTPLALVGSQTEHLEPQMAHRSSQAARDAGELGLCLPVVGRPSQVLSLARPCDARNTREPNPGHSRGWLTAVERVAEGIAGEVCD